MVATSVARSILSSDDAYLTSILSDSSATRATGSPVTTPSSLVTRTLSTTASTTIASSSSAGTESSTSTEGSSSRSPESSASSTAAPKNSGAGVGRVEEFVLGLVVGAVGWLMI